MSSVFSVLDSGFHTVYSGFQILDSRFLQLSATWIPDPNRIGIPQSLSGIPDSKAQDSEFNKQKLPSFRNPYYLRQGVRYCIGVIGESYFPSCLFPENERKWHTDFRDRKVKTSLPVRTPSKSHATALKFLKGGQFFHEGGISR